MSMKGIDPVQARKLATYLEGDAQREISDISKKFLEVKEDLPNCWRAKDSITVQNDMETISSSLTEMSTNFTEIANWLNHYATQAEQSNS